LHEKFSFEFDRLLYALYPNINGQKSHRRVNRTYYNPKANHPHPVLSVIREIPKEHDVQDLRQAMFTTQKTYPKLADWAAFNLAGAAQ